MLRVFRRTTATENLAGKLPSRLSSDFPELYQTADRGAVGSQRLHYGLLAIELILLSVVAVAQAAKQFLGSLVVRVVPLHIDAVSTPWGTVDTATATAAVVDAVVPGLFLAMVTLMFWIRWRARPDELWRGRRAIAEVVEELSWRYSMKALPGDLPRKKPGDFPAERGFVEAMKPLIALAKQLGLNLPDGTGSVDEITTRMGNLRVALPSERFAAYMRDRFNYQLRFYRNRERRFRNRGVWLRRSIIGLYIVGGILLLPLGAVSVVTTAAGGLATWLAARRYEDLSQSYAGMVRDLSGLSAIAKDLKLGVDDPLAAEHLAIFVDEVETLFAGEHQDWLVRVAQ